MSIPLQQIYDNSLREKAIKLFVLRLDLLHPLVNGNKWFKLKYNLEAARAKGKTTLLSFGGAYSNHIHALAAAGKEYGFKTIGIIRGEETLPLNNTLRFATQCGMRLLYISRELYRDMEKALASVSHHLDMNDTYVIPEGGSNAEGVRGCMEMIREINIPFDHVVCACGTGATLAGIALSLNEKQKVTGIPVLKGGEFLEQEILAWKEHFGNPSKNFELKTEYHSGGYAKADERLLQFISSFEELHHIPLDHVYTGKMMSAVFDLARKKYFKRGETVIAVHSGGLQAGKFNAE